MLADQLRTERLTVRYGPIVAIDSVEVLVPRGSIVAVLGANGAGKSTLLRSIAGAVKPTAGRIHVGDADVTGWPAHRVVRHGVTLVSEGHRIVAPLTVSENLDLGYRAAHPGQHKDAAVLGRMADVLELFPALGKLRGRVSGSLSGGEQQMLAIARGLMADPKFLLLDEPSLGLAPIVIERIYELLRNLPKLGSGVGVLLAEQSGNLARASSDHLYVLAKGRVVLDGPPSVIGGDSELFDFYLGGMADDVGSAAIS